jgi:hypothetical protein
MEGKGAESHFPLWRVLGEGKAGKVACSRGIGTAPEEKGKDEGTKNACCPMKDVFLLRAHIE